jgi:hypothetical protein
LIAVLLAEGKERSQHMQIYETFLSNARHNREIQGGILKTEGLAVSDTTASELKVSIGYDF